MSFGVQDPLGDLSDGSNDSFFDEPKLTTKRGSLTKSTEKKSVSDLFNLSDSKSDVKESKTKADDWLGLGQKESSSILDVKKSPARTPKVVKKISFEDDDDILGNLGFSKKPGKVESDAKIPDNPEEKSKKMDLLESILGPTKSEEKKITFDDILKESKAQPVEPKPRVVEPIGEVPREGRRGRRSSGNLMDPLGLFSSETKSDLNAVPKRDESDLFNFKSSTTVQVDKVTPTESKSTPNIPDHTQGLPDWLGGASTVKVSKSEGALNPIEEPPKPEIIEETAPAEIMPTPQPHPQITQDTSDLNSLLTQQRFVHSNVEYKNTAIALQQQESQLLMALQLKKYEEKLSEMQMKQQEVLMKQEHQFNTLLDKQFAKQEIMENNMRLQQERINNHIQLLISQPSVARYSGQDELEELKKNANEESGQLYETMINSLKQRQHEELFLMEESYKKQISLLEQSLESVESRLRSDTEKLSESFQEKINTIAKEREEEISKYKQKILEVEETHGAEIKQIRENHVRVLEEIKYEQSTLLENIKQARHSEAAMFHDSTSYAQKLDTNIAILAQNTQTLQELNDNVENGYGVLSKAREESLKAREQEIILMKKTLDKCRESAEEERAQLLSLVRSLETKIAEQNQNGREERWALQVAASTLTARSAALEREAEFNRASIERERDQLKTLKKSILAEQEKAILQLTEEKLSLSAEQSRLRTSTKLNVNYDSQRAKVEIEAAMQVAKDAAEMTDREREKLQRQQCEIEKLKRTLVDRERNLDMKQSDLENSLREAERKVKDGERAMLEARAVEGQYNERLRLLQNQLTSLSAREKKLAEEKIGMSRERLALHTMLRQTKKCGLCAVNVPRIEDLNDNLYFDRFDKVNDIGGLPEQPSLHNEENALD